MATSDLKILKRLSTVETDLGHNDLDLEDEDHTPTIPEKFSILTERIDTIAEIIEASEPHQETTEETIKS